MKMKTYPMENKLKTIRFNAKVTKGMLFSVPKKKNHQTI